MKCYTWLNSYTMGGENQSIQVAHSQIGLCKKYIEDENVLNWMDDKTSVVLKGKDHGFLLELSEFLEMGYIPWYSFRESIDSLNGAMTSVSCIPTDDLINAAYAFRTTGKRNFIYRDNSLYMQIYRDNANPNIFVYTGFSRDDIKYAEQEFLYSPGVGGFTDTLESLSERIEVKKFTPWEASLIERIAGGRLA